MKDENFIRLSEIAYDLERLWSGLDYIRLEEAYRMNTVEDHEDHVNEIDSIRQAADHLNEAINLINFKTETK